MTRTSLALMLIAPIAMVAACAKKPPPPPRAGAEPGGAGLRRRRAPQIGRGRSDDGHRHADGVDQGRRHDLHAWWRAASPTTAWPRPTAPSRASSRSSAEGGDRAVSAAAGLEPYAPLGVLKPLGRDIWMVDGPVVAGASARGHAAAHHPDDRGAAARRAAVAACAGRADPRPRGGRSARSGGWRRWCCRTGCAARRSATGRRPFPAAVTWCAPGLAETAAAAASASTTSSAGTPPSAWSGAIAQVLVRGGFLTEAVFLHRPSRTLVLSDLDRTTSSAAAGRAGCCGGRCASATCGAARRPTCGSPASAGGARCARRWRPSSAGGPTGWCRRTAGPAARRHGGAAPGAGLDRGAGVAPRPAIRSAASRSAICRVTANRMKRQAAIGSGRSADACGGAHAGAGGVRGGAGAGEPRGRGRRLRGGGGGACGQGGRGGVGELDRDDRGGHRDRDGERRAGRRRRSGCTPARSTARGGCWRSGIPGHEPRVPAAGLLRGHRRRRHRLLRQLPEVHRAGADRGAARGAG